MATFGWSTTLVQTEISILISIFIISITVGWIAMKSGADIHGAPMRNPNDFGDPLSFHIVPLTLSAFIWHHHT